MSRRGLRLPHIVLVAVVLLTSGAAPPGSNEASLDDQDDGSFNFSPPIACNEIRGYENYVPLPDASLTADEKLLIYFRPRHFKSVRKGNKYEVHFTQDGQVRRRGEKAVVLKIKPMEFKSTYPTPPEHIYLTNTIALKGVKPGDYDFEITLRDAIGKSAPATRNLQFTVVAPVIPEQPAEKTDKPDAP